ncbi:MAG: hypothetical protein ACRCTJ_01865 [Brevinema sp.]
MSQVGEEFEKLYSYFRLGTPVEAGTINYGNNSAENLIFHYPVQIEWKDLGDKFKYILLKIENNE